MYVKNHGKAPRGFPQSFDGKVEAILFLAEETKEVSKAWLETFKEHPQVKSLLIKGPYGGLEIVGNHEKILSELYVKGLESKEERLEQVFREKEALLAFATARNRSEPLEEKVISSR